MSYRIEFEREDDGRWIADIPELPGVMAYGSSKREAESKVQAMLEHIEWLDDIDAAESTLENIRTGRSKTISLETAMKKHSLDG